MRAPADHRTEQIEAPADGQGDAASASVASIVRSRLFLKYIALFVAVVSLALIANGAFEVWFSYQEHKTRWCESSGNRLRPLPPRSDNLSGDRKPGRLDHAAPLVGRDAGAAPLRRPAPAPAGARDHRACADRFIWA